MDPRLQQAKREKAKRHKELFDRAYSRVKSQLDKNLNKDKVVTGTQVYRIYGLMIFKVN